MPEAVPDLELQEKKGKKAASRRPATGFRPPVLCTQPANRAAAQLARGILQSGQAGVKASYPRVRSWPGMRSIRG